MILLKVKYNKNVVIIYCSKYLNVVIIVNVIFKVIFISLYSFSNKETGNNKLKINNYISHYCKITVINN